MNRKFFLDLGINFLLESIDPETNGSRAFYSPLLYPYKFGWSDPYPETTGYIIKTFDDLIYDNDYQSLEPTNEKMAKWLLSIQMDDGSFSGGLYNKNKKNEKSIFNTAQIIIGLFSRFIRTKNEIYLESGLKASNWLGNCVNKSGFFEKYNYHPGFMPSYYSRVCWPMLLFKDFSGYNGENIKKIKLVINNIIEKKLKNHFISDSGFKPNNYAFLHTIAYTIRGLIECSILLEDKNLFETSIKISEIFMKKYEIKKKLGGAYHEDFTEISSYRCLTGEAQMVIVWNKISQISNDLRFYNTGLKLLDSLVKEVPVKSYPLFAKGGLCGSKPYWGKYISFRQPNWATKFLIDAILEEEKTKNLIK